MYSVNQKFKIMASNYSLFVFAYNLSVPPSAISECLAAWTKCEVDRVDYVMTANSNSSYYFVHFKNALPHKILKMLESGQEPLRTRGGDIQVALDKSKGLDPDTLDTIVQFIVNKQGSYHRYFNNPNTVFIYDQEAADWVISAENPFEIQEVEMEDDFTVADDISFESDSTTSATTAPIEYGAPFGIQSVEGIYSSDEESTVDQAPWAPIKKQKKKRYVKSALEMEICRTLFI
jgi:hypothetical protein